MPISSTRSQRWYYARHGFLHGADHTRAEDVTTWSTGRNVIAVYLRRWASSVVGAFVRPVVASGVRADVRLSIRLALGGAAAYVAVQLLWSRGSRRKPAARGLLAESLSCRARTDTIPHAPPDPLTALAAAPSCFWEVCGAAGPLFLLGVVQRTVRAAARGWGPRVWHYLCSSGLGVKRPAGSDDAGHVPWAMRIRAAHSRRGDGPL